MSEPRPTPAEPDPYAAPFVVDALPEPQAAAPAPEPGPEPERRGALGHLAAGFGDVLSRPRVLVLLIALAVLLALPAAMPVFRSAHLHLAPVAPPAEGPGIDFEGVVPDWLLADWGRRDPSLHDFVADILAPLVLLSSWLGLLVSAGWMGVARDGRRGHGPARFLAAGGRHFFPFLRSWFLGLPLFFGVCWLVWGPPGERLAAFLVPGGELDRAADETAAGWIDQGRELVALFLVLGVEVLLDLGRASMVAGDRRSALLGLLRGFGFFLFEPLRVWTLVGAGLVVELVWLAACAALVGQGLLPLWSLLVLLPFGRAACRGGRHAGLLRLYAEGLPARRGRRRA